MLTVIFNYLMANVQRSTTGLCSTHMRMLDGADGGNTGVMLIHDGRLLSGDAYFYYVGSYTSSDGRWKGKILNQEHTPAKGWALFGGHDTGIGFSGTCTDETAEIEATERCPQTHAARLIFLLRSSNANAQGSIRLFVRQRPSGSVMDVLYFFCSR